MRNPTIEELKQIHDSEHWQALVGSPGFQMLVESAQREAIQTWKGLLSIEPEKLKAAQGYLDGINYVLGYADAQVQDAHRVVEALREDEASSVEAARTIEKIQRERAHRSSRVGADLS
jgi:hypothetical protein